MAALIAYSVKGDGPDPLAKVRAKAGPYPVELLEGCKDALLLFSAAFHGANDGIHIHDAGLEAVCVDKDGAKLTEMAMLYPDSWTFWHQDVWVMADYFANRGETFDVVSVDCWTGQVSNVLEKLSLWCSLARQLVTVTILPDTRFRAMSGWSHSRLQRSGNASWLVLKREA